MNWRKMAAVFHVPLFNYISDLTPYEFNPGIADSLPKYLDRMDKTFSRISKYHKRQERYFLQYEWFKTEENEDDYYNYKLLELVTKPYERKKILVIIMLLFKIQILSILIPTREDSLISGHIFIPREIIFGMKTDTFVFNISIVLLSSVFLYLTLYFELLGKTVGFFENLKFRK